MDFGTKIAGEAKPIPTKMLTDSVIGSIYEINMETSTISNQEETAALLVTQLEENFHNLKVNYIDVGYNQIRIQLTGSPFAWSAVLLFLPEILGILGIAILAIGVFLIFSQVPGWIIALMLVGGVMMFAGPVIRSLTQERLKTLQVM